jgi:hydroxysqualene synthase
MRCRFFLSRPRRCAQGGAWKARATLSLSLSARHLLAQSSQGIRYSRATLSIDHYENFPVASVLCPPSIRPAVVAIYHFARTADDLADEGDANPSDRLKDLQHYRLDLLSAASGQQPSARWSGVFDPLARCIRHYDLPPQHLHALLDAFEQDVRNPWYADRNELLDYCSRSANPVGRLLLHLYGINDALSLQRSDALCTALQLINFWQDLSVDGPRGRHYIPQVDLQRFGVTAAQTQSCHDSKATRALVAELCAWAHGLMMQGAPLSLHVPGRAGWELRLVVQGGLRILEKIAVMKHAATLDRPKITASDFPLMLWRSWRMQATTP